MRKLMILLICLFPLFAGAEDSASSVEDNIKIMDTDHDGQVTVTEVRAYLQSQHGKDYKQALLEDMETRAGIKSCGSPFSKSLY